MNQTFRFALVLLIVGAISGGVLAFSNGLTAPIIAERAKEQSFGAYAELFSEADDFVAIDGAKLDEIKANNIFVQEVFEAKKGGEKIGYTFKTKSGGYGGDIITVTGIALDGTITEIRVIEQMETPGLGTKIVDDKSFQESFVGKSTTDEVMLISGATVSSEGVLYGVNGALEAFTNYLSE